MAAEEDAGDVLVGLELFDEPRNRHLIQNVTSYQTDVKLLYIIPCASTKTFVEVSLIIGRLTGTSSSWWKGRAPCLWWRGSRKCKDGEAEDDGEGDFARRILETILRTEGISAATAESGQLARRQARLRDAIRERYTEAMVLASPSELAEVLQQTEREMLVRVKSFLRF